MMTLLAGLQIAALQLASAEPSLLTVRSGSAATSVPVIATVDGPAISLPALGSALPISVREIASGRFLVSAVGVQIEIIDRLPFVRVRDSIVPMAASPFAAGGQLHVPLQLIADVLPRLAPARLAYDRRRGELHFAPEPPSSPAVATDGRRAPVATGRLRHRYRVVVDAGHGGPDRGMTGPMGARRLIYEKDVTLDVARHLRTELRSRGLDVVMTRTTDTLIALSDRGRLANQQRGDLFISVHVNAANPRWTRPQDARGVETYFLAEARTEDAKRVEQMENEAVRFETGVHAPKHDPLSFLLTDMRQNEHLRESSELAAMVQERLALMHPGPDRGVKQAGFRVLVTAFMPAILVEIGFGTNAEEARFLSTNARQREIAAAIAEAAMLYLRQYERRLGAATP